MKKKLLVLFALLCALPYAWAQATTSQPAVGDGSAANSYQITSPDELRWFALHVGEGTANAAHCAKLMNDITMSTMTVDPAPSVQQIRAINPAPSESTANAAHCASLWNKGIRHLINRK